MLLALEAGCRRHPPAPDLAPLTARMMGLLHLERDELPEAEAEFRKLIALAPREPLGYSALATVYLRAGRLPEAERQVRRALALDSADPTTVLLLASIYQRTGRIDSARVRLEQLETLDRPEPRALYALAQLSRQAADSAGPYLEYLKRLVALLPANLALRLELAEAQLDRRQPDSTLQELEALRQLPPAPPSEAGPFLEQAIRSLRGTRVVDARTALARFRRLLEVTPAYQAARQAIADPGHPLIGVAALAFSPRQAMLQRLGQDPEAIREAVRFEDVTTTSGLARLPDGAAGVNGLAVALGDYDGDGTDDLFLAGRTALLLRSQPGGFMERSAHAGVVLPRGAIAAAFADYDNDGYLDLYAADDSGLGHLFHNTGRGSFRDVAREAGLARVQPLPHQALFVDLDHDGDLDLLLREDSGLRLFRNNLDGTFREVTASSGLAGAAGRDATFGDFDGDGLTDLVVANPVGRDALYSNRGQGRFEDVAAARGLTSPSRGSGVVAAGDYDNDGLLDLFVAGSGQAVLYRNAGTASGFLPDRRSDRTFGILDFIQVRAAVFLDYDNDGFQDLAVVGEPSASGRTPRGALLFRNDGTGRFEDRSSILPPGLTSAQHVVAWDQDRDGDLDLLVSGGPGGPRLLRNDGGNLNLYVNVELKGLRTGSGKNNDFGIGATVELRAGELYETRTVTSRVTHFGVGRHLKADVLRIVWPNGVPQIVYLPGTDQDVLEQQILKGSCPFVYAWDGHGYRFVTDVMWRSALGMPVGIMGTGTTAFAPAQASREYLRIPGSRLAAKDGHYLLQFTEELWETAYLDELQLLVVDHPDSVDVFVNERFVPPDAPSPLHLYRIVRPRPPVAAVDAEGNDQLPLLRAADDRFVAGFSSAEYQGLTVPHELILDLGDAGKGAGSFLLLTGWIFPSDASINVALSQRSDRPVLPPALDVMDARGRWTTVIPDVGFPSGKNKTVIVDLAGRFPTGNHRVRLRTNLQIYWDRALIAAEAPAAPVTLTSLPPVSAKLHARGFSRSYRKGGPYGPHWFDYDSVSMAARWRPIAGALTRFGDVLPLLDRSDDRYVIMGPGDETTVQFDAAQAPPVPPGWTRDFLLYSNGWIKDADLNTATGSTVEPLPFHAMTRYPYGAGETYPRDAAHREFVATYNTRRISSGTTGLAAGKPGGRQP